MRIIQRYVCTAIALICAGSSIAQQGSSAAPIERLTGTTLFSGTNAEFLESITEKKVKEEDTKSKEVSLEIPMPKGGEVYMELSSRNVIVKIWDQPKIKVVTTAIYTGDVRLTDEQWFEKLNVTLKALGTSVKIKAGSTGSSIMYFNGASTATVNGSRVLESGTVQAFPSTISGATGNSGNVITVAGSPSARRIITVYMPANTKVDIESKYGDVKLPANIGDALVDISNGNLEAENLGKLRLRSKYSNANIGDIKEAEVEFANGRFTAKAIDELDIESKYATIEMASAKSIKLVSTNDEFEVEDVADIRGRKNYGNLRITRLSSSIELEGSNADVKIRNVGAAVKLIKVDNRYADVRIPLRDYKNYSVDFTGPYSTVYGDFEKTPVAYEPKEDKEVKKVIVDGVVVSGTVQATTLAPAGTVANDARVRQLTSTAQGALAYRYGGSNTPPKFTATVGDGKGLKIEMKCQNCTVDFK